MIYRILILLSIPFCAKQVKSQEIKGYWYSHDHTRIYEIKEKSAGKYIAVIAKTERKNDHSGFESIRDLTYDVKEQVYQGSIYSIYDDTPAQVKITAHNNELLLRITVNGIRYRTIKWSKASL